MKNKSAENLVNKTAPETDNEATAVQAQKTTEKRNIKRKTSLDRARELAAAALIAALYAAATWLASVFGLAYGPVQFRFSEALTVLSVFTPAALPGLTLGCAISNLTGLYGVIDVVLGSLATLLAALTARKLRNVKLGSLPLLSIIMPVIFNALIVGAEISFSLGSGASLRGFFLNAAQIGFGELVVCLGGGIPLYYVFERSGIFKNGR